jgi:hypothetical protein
MNTQIKLSDLDAAILSNFNLRQRVLTLERQAFEAKIMADYGNPDEELAVGTDNSITRRPREPAVPTSGPTT